jgi:hypothetical protein
MPARIPFFPLCTSLILTALHPGSSSSQTYTLTTEPITEVANNDSNTPPFWEYHQTTITRINDRVYASSMETVDPGFDSFVKQWRLYERADTGWQQVYESPLDQPLNQPPVLLAGPGDTLHVFASPEGRFTHFAFDINNIENPTLETPDIGFTEFWPWSSGSINQSGDIGIAMVTGGDDRQHIQLRDATTGDWSAGVSYTFDTRSESPTGYDRHTFPFLVLDDGAAHIFSAQDIVDPVKVAEGASYTFSSHSLDYYYSPDVAATAFQTVSIVDIEGTRGWAHNDDLLLDASGVVHTLYYTQAEQNVSGFSPEMHAFGPPGGPFTHVSLASGFTEGRLWEGPDGTLYALLPAQDDLYIAALAEDGALAASPEPLGLSPGNWGSLFAGPRIFLSSSRGSAVEITVLEGIYRRPTESGRIELRYFRVDAPELAVPIGDFNSDGRVDFNDFLLFVAQYGQAATSNTPSFDLSENGAIDFDDFLIFAGVFGTIYRS